MRTKKVKGIIELGAVLAVLGGSLAYLKTPSLPTTKSSAHLHSVQIRVQAFPAYPQRYQHSKTNRYLKLSALLLPCTAKAKVTKENPYVHHQGLRKYPLVNTTIYTLANNVSELDSLSVVTDSG